MKSHLNYAVGPLFPLNEILFLETKSQVWEPETSPDETKRRIWGVLTNNSLEIFFPYNFGFYLFP